MGTINLQECLQTNKLFELLLYIDFKNISQKPLSISTFEP